MLYSILTFILTIIIAPLTFYFLSHYIYNKKGLKKFPTQLNDKYGDTIFLPLYNAIFVYLLIQTNHQLQQTTLTTSIITAAILTIIYVHYQKNSSYLDWSKPKKGKLNLGGYYHATYMFIQIAIIVYATIIFTKNLMLWITISGYLITTLIQYIKFGYI